MQEQQRRNVILIMDLATMLFWSSLYAYVPYLSTYLNAIGIVASIIGYISSSYGLAMLFTRIPIGIWGDMIDRQKPFIFMGAALTTLSSLGMFLCTHTFSMVFFRFLSGVAAATWVSYISLYSSYFPKERTTRAVAALNMYANLGRVMASIIGAIVSKRFGYKAPFLASFFIGAAGMVLCFFVTDIRDAPQPSTEPERRMSVTKLLSTLKERSLIVACIFGAVVQFISYATIYTFTNTFAQDIIGASQFELGIMQAIVSVAGVAATFILSTKLIDKLEDNTLIAVAFVVMTASTLAYPFCRNMYLLYCVHFMMGMGLGFGLTPFMSMSIKYVERSKRSTAMGVFQAVYSFGMTLGPIAMGYMVEYGGYLSAFLQLAAFIAMTGVAGFTACRVARFAHTQ